MQKEWMSIQTLVNVLWDAQCLKGPVLGYVRNQQKAAIYDKVQDTVAVLSALGYAEGQLQADRCASLSAECVA